MQSSSAKVHFICWKLLADTESRGRSHLGQLPAALPGPSAEPWLGVTTKRYKGPLSGSWNEALTTYIYIHFTAQTEAWEKRRLWLTIHCKHNKYNLVTTNCRPYDTAGCGEKEREALWELMFFLSIEKQMSFWCWTISTPVNYACGLEITPSFWDCFHFDCFLFAPDNKNIFRQLNKSFITLMGLLVHSKQLCKLLIMRQR